MDLEDELEELEESFEETEEEFKAVKDKAGGREPSEKQEKAEELVKEIRGQLEFLRDAMDKQ